MSLPSALKQLTSNVFSGSPLSQSASASEVALPDPADAPTGVQLSGNIISATFLTPYTIGYRRHAGATDNKHVTWELTPRRGSSALYDTLKHLASKENKWNHTIIGWTGEISEVDQDSKYNPTQHLQNSRLAQTGNPPPAQVATAGKPTPPNALSARNKSHITPPPVPIVGDGDDRMTMKGDYSRVRTEEEQNPCVSQEERDDLQKTLSVKCKDVGWDKIRAVWLGDEKDGGISLTNIDRWMAYAEKGMF
jgi:trehalose 6-phosphate synthase/phosphatase